ncbi:hypothetical protein [Corynebacterium uterequi]|uniref:Uncharacterized protein n=1 Tax=Corynebacterium uterequi TaxID=1072256 RepID=A0A0G3HAN8_9CORY|nr:hypothetical protein [Corynebacterium uterequi]AKK10421.1 hypothetical protein CUTER_02030 [Corynebacterium uterequi]
MATSPYDQETRDRVVRMYLDELEAGAETKAAALRAVSAVTGVKRLFTVEGVVGV